MNHFKDVSSPETFTLNLLPEARSDFADIGTRRSAA